MARLYKRKFSRFIKRNDSNLEVKLNYMGQELNATPTDINSDGIGLIIEKHPFSLIDYSIIDIKLSTDKDMWSIPSRVLHSQKLGSSGRKRRYGFHFLNADDRPKLPEIIKEHFEPYHLERR